MQRWRHQLREIKWFSQRLVITFPVDVILMKCYILTISNETPILRCYNLSQVIDTEHLYLRKIRLC